MLSHSFIASSLAPCELVPRAGFSYLCRLSRPGSWGDRLSCDPPNADALGAVFGHFALCEDVPCESPPSRDVDRIDGSEE